jgi:hypothetical protein
MPVFRPGAIEPHEYFVWCVTTPKYLSMARDWRVTTPWAYRRALRLKYFHHKDSCPGHDGSYCNPRYIAREVGSEEK